MEEKEGRSTGNWGGGRNKLSMIKNNLGRMKPGNLEEGGREILSRMKARQEEEEEDR